MIGMFSMGAFGLAYSAYRVGYTAINFEDRTLALILGATSLCLMAISTVFGLVL